LYIVLGVLFRPQPWITLLAGAGCLALLERLGTERDRGILLPSWVVSLPMAYSAMNPQGRHLLVGNFGRYMFPLFPPLVLLGVIGIERAADALGPWLRAGSRRWPVRALLAVALLWPTVTTLIEGATRYAENVANVEDGDVQVAWWLRDNVPPQALLAVEDIGAIRFYAPQRIVDVIGIANPQVRKYVRAA